jgi:hypothetical protein
MLSTQAPIEDPSAGAGRRAQNAVVPAEDQTFYLCQSLDVLDVRDRQRQPQARRWLVDVGDRPEDQQGLAVGQDEPAQVSEPMVVIR